MNPEEGNFLGVLFFLAAFAFKGDIPQITSRAMKGGDIIGLLLTGAFLAICAAGFSSSRTVASRLPNLPKDAKFEVTAAVVELKPTDALLAGDSFKTLLDDIPKRSTIGLKLLEANGAYDGLIRAEDKKVLRQGDDFALSFDLPKESDSDTGVNPHLRHAAARVQLDSVDTLHTAEINVTGSSEWYADLMKTNHSTEFGAGIGGFPRCLPVGQSDWIPLFVQPEGSAWIVVSVKQVD